MIPSFASLIQESTDFAMLIMSIAMCEGCQMR